MRCRTRGATRKIGFALAWPVSTSRPWRRTHAAARPQLSGDRGVGVRSQREPGSLALKAIGQNTDA
jgi:hypothetical protein